jgi:hypothetical protein
VYASELNTKQDWGSRSPFAILRKAEDHGSWSFLRRSRKTNFSGRPLMSELLPKTSKDELEQGAMDLVRHCEVRMTLCRGLSHNRPSCVRAGSDDPRSSCPETVNRCSSGKSWVEMCLQCADDGPRRKPAKPHTSRKPSSDDGPGALLTTGRAANEQDIKSGGR